MNQHLPTVFGGPGAVFNVLVAIDDEPGPGLTDADGFHWSAGFCGFLGTSSSLGGIPLRRKIQAFGPLF